MKLIKKISDLKKAIQKFDNIGFIPTMGGLHKGHISLIKTSSKKCNKNLVSIYVNPKQFNKKKDFIDYPREINKDLNILKKLNVDIVFLPSTSDIYRSRRLKKIILRKMSDKQKWTGNCGKRLCQISCRTNCSIY